ncbi:MAG: hypothetical protein V3V61_04540 [Gammaproteobacteria bacterium]
MQSIQHGLKKRLPIVTLDSDVIGTSELQKVSSAYLDLLKEKGVQIVAVGGVKKAVLIDYDQFIHFQETFSAIFKQMSVINEILPRIPEGHKFHIEELRLEISGTLRRIVNESPESSPFADLMDAILGVAAGLFENNVEAAPAHLKKNAQNTLSSTAQKVKKKNVRPKRNLTE